jgi:cathepsin L|eukprot:g3448.t1
MSRALTVLALVAAASARTLWTDLRDSEYSFEQYKQEFNKVYEDSAEHAVREARFIKQLAEIRAHNEAGHSWKMGVNKFTDMSTTELSAFKGLRRDGNFDGATPFNLSTVPVSALPASKDWRDAKPAVVTPVKNQGGCGSCWAFSTVETLESAVAIATGKLLTLSPQQVVSCAPNPKDCGGTGGCEGSVQWLGFNYTEGGIALDSDYPYTAQTGTCKSVAGKVVAGNTGYTRLPANDYTALMNAVATLGPMAISVDASWSGYESGVYTGKCGSTIDHAVVLVGYGEEAGTKYYLVRNSWGESWGEGGYIKIKRDDDDSTNCATDTNPSSGTECKPYPQTQKVCGACGILSDSSYPTGAFAK